MKRRFPAVFARGLADAQAQREPEMALSCPFLSEPGDLGDEPAGLKGAEILGFLRRKGGGVGEAHDPPITTESELRRRVSAVATGNWLADDGGLTFER